MNNAEFVQAARRLMRDAIDARASGDDELRYVVKTYYTIQDWRIRSMNQLRAAGEAGKPRQTVSWLAGQTELLERLIKVAISDIMNHNIAGQWLMSIKGIGPVLAAGLVSHIDITKAKTAGSIWRYAGLDPTITWSKGERRPYNADLKTLCYKVGESFVKVSGREDPPIYSVLYRRRKKEEWIRNMAGEYADQALEASNRVGKNTDAYKWYSGSYVTDDRSWEWADSDDSSVPPLVSAQHGTPMLPPAHIHARARRYAVKLLLSHLHSVLWWLEYGTPPPKPYILTQENHTHVIVPPNLDLFDELSGLEEAIWKTA